MMDRGNKALKIYCQNSNNGMLELQALRLKIDAVLQLTRGQKPFESCSSLE